MSISSKLRRATRWLRGTHLHRFKPSGWNAYGTCIEQRCRCGEYRHHGFDDLVGEYPWSVGKWHPGPAPKGEVTA